MVSNSLTRTIEELKDVKFDLERAEARRSHGREYATFAHRLTIKLEQIKDALRFFTQSGGEYPGSLLLIGDTQLEYEIRRRPRFNPGPSIHDVYHVPPPPVRAISGIHYQPSKTKISFEDDDDDDEQDEDVHKEDHYRMKADNNYIDTTYESGDLSMDESTDYESDEYTDYESDESTDYGPDDQDCWSIEACNIAGEAND